jgi:hypothetical protein
MQRLIRTEVPTWPSQNKKEIGGKTRMGTNRQRFADICNHSWLRFPSFRFQLSATRSLGLILLATALCGCGTTRQLKPPDARQFDFQKDTFAYANELVWVYGYDASGKWASHRRDPKPDYSLHCVVVARATRQFFENARFDPTQPVADEATYRRLIRAVIATSPRKALPEERRVVIPGYADLREFSEAYPELLKAECGSAWQSYLQRGNWRMIFPFSRREQEEEAERMLAHLGTNGPVIVHLALFPSLALNHTVLAFDAKPDAIQIEFVTYDPNETEKPVSLTYDRAKRTFSFPANSYFQGGEVNAYEIYHRWNY